jgi:7-cyano-7-deazaguanine reductase
MENMPLGKKIAYKDQYDKSLLYPINRSAARKYVGVPYPLPFKGFDIWNCYEISWLAPSGKPEVRIVELIVSADSENIVESKSVKLYLGSFNNTKFANELEVEKLIEADLTEALKAPVILSMKTLEAYHNQPLTLFTGKNLDDLEVAIDHYTIDRNLLKLSGKQDIVSEVLYSNLLKANCYVTGSPDWASIQISYRGKEIAHDSLLKYLISLRNHSEFHEPSIERIFNDIKNICRPDELTVYGRYTRRGGIDINPIRSTFDLNATEVSNLRHIRQ